MNFKKKQVDQKNIMYQSYSKLCSIMTGMGALKTFSYLTCLAGSFFVIIIIDYIQNLVNLCINVELDGVKKLIGKLLFFILAYMVISLVQQIFNRLLTVKGKGILWEKLYALLVHKEITFYENNETGDLVSQIQNDAQTVGEYIATGTVSIASYITVFLLNFGIMLSISVPITLITTALLILGFAATDILNRKVADRP